MSPVHEEIQSVAGVIRSLTAAVKTLRLYPPSSPLPAQALSAASAAVAAVLAEQPTLPLAVARQGFTYRGEQVGGAGADDLADVLASHGVAELDFLPGCTPGDLAALLATALRDPADVQAAGGFAAALAFAGASNVVASEVVLTAIAVDTLASEDIDSFLRDLATDESQLAAWLAAATEKDPGALADGLAELARAVGPGRMDTLESTLGKAFLAQSSVGRDALVGLAIHETGATGVLQGMMRTLRPGQVATSLADGVYAKNMLSMSNVLNAIPFGPALDAIIEELRPMLTMGGHTERELSFLDHMLDARSGAGAEAALADRRSDYQRVAQFSSIDAAALTSVREEIGSSAHTVNARTVNTMLSLLDQQTDFKMWSATLTNLAGLVPTLIDHRDVALADRVLADLAGRESRTTRPWPGLADEMRTAMERATTASAMASLLRAVMDDPAQLEHAAAILRRVDQSAQCRFVAAALDQRQRDGLAVAERIFGRRLVGLLVALAPEVQWFQAGTVATRLVGEPDLHSRKALTLLSQRPDEQSRQEVAKALASSSDPYCVTILAQLAKDPALEVAITAVRSLGHTSAREAAGALSAVFDGLESTGKDFPLGREVLGALARTPDPAATDVLERIAKQRALIKRGHFSEIVDLARQALAVRAKEGGRR